jgi:hypothetical protein
MIVKLAIAKVLEYIVYLLNKVVIYLAEGIYSLRGITNIVPTPRSGREELETILFEEVSDYLDTLDNLEYSEYIYELLEKPREVDGFICLLTGFSSYLDSVTEDVNEL